jgi:hypothetical protein
VEAVSSTCLVPGGVRRFPTLAGPSSDCEVRLSFVEEYFIKGGGGNSNAPSCAEWGRLIAKLEGGSIGPFHVRVVVSSSDAILRAVLCAVVKMTF